MNKTIQVNFKVRVGSLQRGRCGFFSLSLSLSHFIPYIVYLFVLIPCICIKKTRNQESCKKKNIPTLIIKAKPFSMATVWAIEANRQSAYFTRIRVPCKNENLALSVIWKTIITVQLQIITKLRFCISQTRETKNRNSFMSIHYGRHNTYFAGLHTRPGR